MNALTLNEALAILDQVERLKEQVFNEWNALHNYAYGYEGPSVYITVKSVRLAIERRYVEIQKMRSEIKAIKAKTTGKSCKHSARIRELAAELEINI